MDSLWAPFVDYMFMRRALVATLALSLSAAPLGVFLTLRRMSLLGDALSHAVLPGVAVGYMVAGLSVWAMAAGGVVAGLLVASISGVVSRLTPLKEDASMAAIYLVALALGVALISSQGTQLDLLHILFGSALGVDNDGLLLVACVATGSVVALALLYRPIVLETFDPVFLKVSHSNRLGGWVWHHALLVLVVVNLVAGFQALGTLMAVGLMMLPAVSARLWHTSLPAQLVNASVQAAAAGIAGLLLSFHYDLPSGPTIIGCAGALYAASLLLTSLPRRFLVGSALLLVLPVPHAQVHATDTVSARVPVVVSFSILGDLVHVVGGGRVAITTLVGPDQDAHVFEPKPSDARGLVGAKLLVVNGLGFEPWADKLASSAGYKGLVAVASAGAHARPGDPHAWQDPSMVVLYVRNIAQALSRVDPGGTAIYQANAAAYEKELQALDAWAATQFARIPVAQRKVVTSHDAFAYFAARYNIQFLAAQGINTDAEPSAKQVARLIRQIQREKIRAVFVENMANPRLIAQISKDTGVTLGERLYADALSATDKPGATYLQMLRHNVTQLVAGMQRN